LTVENAGVCATATFKRRIFGDEAALTNPIGLTLVFSDRRFIGNTWVHEFVCRVFPGETSLGDAPDLVRFLRLLKSGSVLYVDGARFIELDELPSLTAVGSSLEGLIEISNALGIEIGQFQLSDLREREPCFTLRLLDALFLAKKPFEQLGNSFVIGTAAEIAETESTMFPVETVSMNIPIVMNLRSVGIVIWVRARGSMYLRENRWCGIRIEKQESLRSELHPRFSKGEHPEMWVNKHWPPIPLGTGFGMQPIEIFPSEYITVEGEIWRTSEDDG